MQERFSTVTTIRRRIKLKIDRLRKNLDLLIATGIFLITGTTTAFALAKIIRQAEKPRVLFAEIITGQQSYSLRSDKGCAGWLDSHLTIDSSPKWINRGTLWVQHEDLSEKAELYAEFVFSADKFLRSLQFHLKATSLEIKLESSQSDPSLIALAIRTKKSFRQINHRLQESISLAESVPGEFQMHSSESVIGHGTIVLALLRAIIQDFEILKSAPEESSQLCSEDNTHLELDLLIRLLTLNIQQETVLNEKNKRFNHDKN